jgi:hypothetical protein
MPVLTQQKTYVPQLTANGLKILAAFSMLLDHIGYMFFPDVGFWRYIGRIAMPIFSFMIAEGCCHTRNKLKYFLHVFVLGAVCQSVYSVAMGDTLLCVPVAFAISIPLVYALQAWKKALFGKRLWGSLLWGLTFGGGVAGLWLLTRSVITIDYGFWGCMLPVAASLLRMPENAPKVLKKWDRNLCHVLTMTVCMVFLALEMGTWQWWSMLALPFLKLYSGKRGAWRMKYFFYIFYPAHLVALEGLYWLLNR